MPAVFRQLSMVVVAVLVSGVMAMGLPPASVAAAAPIKFAVLGDYGVADANEQAVANVISGNISAASGNFVVTVGDNVYGSVTYATGVTPYYGSFIGKTPKQFFPAIGNHDNDDAGALAPNPTYLQYFGPALPGPSTATSNTSGSNNYYDFVKGDVHFFVLDTESIASTATPNTSGAQYLWLKAQMAASSSLYKIVIVPQTPFSSSNMHAGVGPDGGASLEYLQWPYEAWGATAVFSGDEHNYERLMRDENSDGKSIPYIVTGNGGRVLNGYDTPAVAGSAFQSQTFGAVIITVDATGMKIDERSVAGGGAGTLIDTVSIAPPMAWTAYVDTNINADGSNPNQTMANVLQLDPSTTTPDPFSPTDTFVLKKFSDGSALPVSVQVDSNVDTIGATASGDTSTAGQAGLVFRDSAAAIIVDGQGVYSYNGDVANKFDLNFTGLNNARTYTLVVTANRADPSGTNNNRWSTFRLTDTSSFIQPNATIGSTYVIANGGADVSFNTGNNGTNGFVAKWTNISPGADGDFSVVTPFNNTGGGDASYPPSMVMLQESSAGGAVPGAPTAVSAAGGNLSATVSWTAPASDGGSAITGYVVTPYIGTTAQTPTNVGVVTTTPVTGLTSGTAYTFKVAAKNVNGTGPESAASNSVTPTGPTIDWTAYVDLRSSTGDSNAANVLEIPEGTIDQFGTGSPINPATNSSVINFANGSATGATMQVANSGLYISSDNGASFTGGPASGVFSGKVDGAGVYSQQSGGVFQLNFAGLDPSKRYTIALSSNRAQDPANRDSDPNGDERWSDFELLDATSATESSGGTTTVVSPTRVRFKSENNTVRGDMAKWISIDPGADGDFSIKSNYFVAGDADRSYVPAQVMLQRTSAAPTLGLLRVTTSPALPAQVSLNGVIADSWGLNWLELTPGNYTVHFSHVEGYTEPADQQVTVSAGNTTTLTGTFTQRGSLRVITSPAVAGQISVDGVPRNDWGMWTDIPTGAHQVCFGPVAGRTTPACQNPTVTAGNLSTVTGLYP